MTDNTARGRFVWHDLMTAAPESAYEFYGKVFGWKKQVWDQDPAHAMFALPTGSIGGTSPHLSGESPHWVPYLWATDVEETRSKALELGGSVVKDITETGSGGRYVLLADPQGARFGVYGSDADPGPEIDPRPGEVHWHELATSDTRAAAAFYSALFGWDKAGEFDMGPMGIYYLFGRAGRQLGGIYDKPADQPGGPAWLGYTRVKDIHRVVKKVQAGLGRLVNGPMEVPTGDWVAMFVDPEGAPFAAVVLKADHKPAKAPAASAAAPASEPVAAAPSEAPAATGRVRKPVAKKPAVLRTKSAAKAAGKKSVGKSAKKSAKKAPAGVKRRAATKGGKRPARNVGQKAGKTAGRRKASGKRVTAAGKSSRKSARKAK